MENEHLDDEFPFDELPRDLKLLVTKAIASNSFHDLMNFRKCNHESYVLSHERVAYEYVNIGSRFGFFLGNLESDDDDERFLLRCYQAGNVQVHWRIGMMEFFSLDQQVEGLAKIRLAAQNDVLEAAYSLGMIMMSRGGDDSHEGRLILQSLDIKLRENWRRYVYIVKNVMTCLNAFWVLMPLWEEDAEHNCPNRRHSKNRIIALGLSYDEEIDTCPSCKFYHDYVKFCLIMRGQ